MQRQYLKDGDRVFSTGCYLVYDAESHSFRFDSIEDSTYFDGHDITSDQYGRYYIGE